MTSPRSNSNHRTVLIWRWIGFGELALLYNTQRTSSIRATETSNLWVIDRQTFREAVEEIITKEYEENRKCLEGIRFFLNLTN